MSFYSNIKKRNRRYGHILRRFFALKKRLFNTKKRFFDAKKTGGVILKKQKKNIVSETHGVLDNL